MFASLKNKIKEETGSDISKLTTSWRSGAFLGRISQKDDSTSSPTSSGGCESIQETISPQIETYLQERTGGQVDQTSLQQNYMVQLEEKLRERDAFWERRIEEMKTSLSSVQGQEAAAAQTVARAAQAEAAEAIAARAAAERLLNELRERVSAGEHAQEKLDVLTEEIESARREWIRERSELMANLSEMEARAQDLSNELTLLRAALPPSHHEHKFDYNDEKVSVSDCEDYDRICRERSVLTRQLQEAKLALADVKTLWSGQIASLETQEKAMALESKLEAVIAENKELTEALVNERSLVQILQEKLEISNVQCGEKQLELSSLGMLVQDLQQDYFAMQKKFEKEKCEKDNALLRNAQMSQSIEMSQSNVRYQEDEITEMKRKILELEKLIGQHKENQAACMLIKENEERKMNEIEELSRRINQLTNSEEELKQTIQNLEAQLSEKNKKIKSLDSRISDMKKTLQRELQSSKSELCSAEEADISRRYLKHVVLRFLTAREIEARQLTRALSVLLRLSAHEEALLQAALPARTGLSSWLPGLSTT